MLVHLRRLAIVLAVCSGLTAVPAQAQDYDLVILNGRVMDPETGLDAVRNVGVKDGKIVVITDDNIQGTHTDIRPDEEIEMWRKKDPIERLKQQLIDGYGINELELEEFHDQVENEIFAAHEFTASSPYPKKSEIQEYVFK